MSLLHLLWWERMQEEDTRRGIRDDSSGMSERSGVCNITLIFRFRF